MSKYMARLAINPRGSKYLAVGVACVVPTLSLLTLCNWLSSRVSDRCYHCHHCQLLGVLPSFLRLLSFKLPKQAAGLEKDRNDRGWDRSSWWRDQLQICFVIDISKDKTRFRSYLHRSTGLMTDPLFISAMASLIFSALYVFWRRSIGSLPCLYRLARCGINWWNSVVCLRSSLGCQLTIFELAFPWWDAQ